MISRTGQILPRPASSSRGARAAGFTLIELVLALALLVLLVSVSTLAIGAWRGNRVLEEGADRVETALRMARAEAANQGRCVRLAFTTDGAQPQVQWEADPLAAPGQFVAFTTCTWQDYLAMDRVQVERCDLVGPSTQRPADWGADLQQDATQAPMGIVFEPDGSSDSAVIELSAAAAGDLRRAVITLDGRTGMITTQIAAPDDQSTQP